MLSVAEINQSFAQKGLLLKLPLPPHWQVKKLDILERKNLPGGIGVLFSVQYLDDEGREHSELFYCEGEVKHEPRRVTPKIERQIKTGYLPRREQAAFVSEAEARDYLRTAFSHLLEDKGYQPAPGRETELYMEKEGQGFFADFALRLDDAALAQAKRLVELRGKYGAEQEYGLVVPAFQEALGYPLRLQEAWVAQHLEFLSAHRIGVYGVDNLDPNRIFPFTVYPRPRELMRYFLYTAQSWHLARSRYVESRPHQG